MRMRGQAVAGFALISPALLHLAVFALWPLLYVLYMSFNRWPLLGDERYFIGIENYRILFADGAFWNAMLNSALFTIGTVPVSLILALALAALLAQPLRLRGLLRTLYFLPVVTSAVAVAMVFSWVYHPEFGLLNYGLSLIGVGGPNWLGDPRFALTALMIMSVWKGLGYSMVIYLAGLSAIPRQLYEVAALEGANAWHRFWQITVPLLKPTTVFLAVTGVIGSFQVFTAVYTMTEGGPLRSTDVAVYHIFRSAFERFHLGYASAQAMVLFAVILGVTLLQVRLLRREVSQLAG
ncbi:sugar ABC transporter permease [bacterium]|nr:sugar ABC transporter permease [bacterium]